MKFSHIPIGSILILFILSFGCSQRKLEEKPFDIETYIKENGLPQEELVGFHLDTIIKETESGKVFQNLIARVKNDAAEYYRQLSVHYKKERYGDNNSSEYARYGNKRTNLYLDRIDRVMETIQVDSAYGLFDLKILQYQEFVDNPSRIYFVNTVVEGNESQPLPMSYLLLLSNRDTLLYYAYETIMEQSVERRIDFAFSNNDLMNHNSVPYGERENTSKFNKSNDRLTFLRELLDIQEHCARHFEDEDGKALFRLSKEHDLVIKIKENNYYNGKPHEIEIHSNNGIDIRVRREVNYRSNPNQESSIGVSVRDIKSEIQYQSSDLNLMQTVFEYVDLCGRESSEKYESGRQTGYFDGTPRRSSRVSRERETLLSLYEWWQGNGKCEWTLNISSRKPILRPDYLINLDIQLDVPVQITKSGLHQVFLNVGGERESFIVDTGASLLTVDEELADRLSRGSLITKLGKVEVSVANGNAVQVERVLIKSIVFTDGENFLEMNDIEAVIMPEGSPRLLGNSVLNRLKSWALDKDQKVLRIRAG